MPGVGEEVGLEARAVCAQDRARGGLLFAGSSTSRLSKKHYPCPRHPLHFRKSSSGQERTVSHCKHPLVISPRALLLPRVTEGQSTRKDGKHVPVYWWSAAATQPAARSTPGHHTISSGPCGHRKFSPKAGDSNTPRTRSRPRVSCALPPDVRGSWLS